MLVSTVDLKASLALDHVAILLVKLHDVCTFGSLVDVLEKRIQCLLVPLGFTFYLYGVLNCLLDNCT